MLLEVAVTDAWPETFLNELQFTARARAWIKIGTFVTELFHRVPLLEAQSLLPWHSWVIRPAPLQGYFLQPLAGEPDASGVVCCSYEYHLLLCHLGALACSSQSWEGSRS